MGYLQNSRANWWPEVDTLEGAKKAVKSGYAAAFIIAAISGAYGIVSVYNGSDFYEIALVYSLIFIFIGWRILKYSRMWPVIAIIVIAVEKLYIYNASGETVHIYLGIVFIVMFLNSARGSEAYHKFMNSKKEEFNSNRKVPKPGARMRRINRQPDRRLP
jgi:hypothetical protein